MSSQYNNPITNSIDFVGHGTKSTSIGNIEHQFNVSQSGSSSDPTNTALTAYSLQSDMLTSAYFNAEVGDLRQMLGSYQIKVDNDNHTNRAIFVGGINKRNNKTSVNVDVNVGNYPVDVADTDTNTGKSWNSGEGIPNMTLKGNSFASSMPIYPITKQNPQISSLTTSQLSADVLNQYSQTSSLMDAIELLKNIFGLSSINMNLQSGNDTDLKYDTTTGVGNMTNVTKVNTTTSNYYTKLLDTKGGLDFNRKNVYVSLTSSVTQWVRVAKIGFEIGKIVQKTYDGLLKTDGTPINIDVAEDIKVKLIIDGCYRPRQMIGNGMSHQQLFIWNERNMGHPTTTTTNMDSILQFTLSDYLIYPKNSTYSKVLKITKSSTQNNVVDISFDLTDSSIPTQDLINANLDKLYLHVKEYNSLLSVDVNQKSNGRAEMYKVSNYNYGSQNISTLTLDRDFNLEDKEFYMVTFQLSTNYGIYTTKQFNIDYIRDRYSMLQLMSHLNVLYKTSSNLTLPIKLVEQMGQVVCDSKRDTIGNIICNNNLSNLLHYISLIQLYAHGNSSTVDIGKKLAQIFDFIQLDSNFKTPSMGGYYGIALITWNDLTDSNDINNDKNRYTCLNTNKEIVYPSDWNTATKTSASGKLVSYNTLRSNKVKHVVITNLPGFDNGRYGTSMSSSNMIHGYFGSLAIDLSYSDTHTPVDVNGMTLHQWNYSNKNNINGLNNPARWNVNADESYRALVTGASSIC